MAPLGCSHSGSPGGAAVRQLRLLLSEGLTRPAESTSMWFTDLAGDFCCMWGFPWELLEDPYNIAADLPQSEASRKPRHKLQCLYDLALKVTHHHFHYILSVTETSLSDSGGERTTKGHKQEVKITGGHHKIVGM